MKKRILIDCDPGIDDALAILLALSESSISVKAITTERGNVDVDQTTRNLVNILQLSGTKYFPKVGKGSPASLSASRVEARLVHGKDGLGETNLNLPAPNLKIENAADLIISEVRSGDVDTIIAIAPLTNIAIVLDRDKRLSEKIKKIYIMGGALSVPGNVTEFAEFNISCDPLAAKKVFTSNIPITLASLDVTQKATLKDSDLARFKNIKTDLSNFIQRIAKYSINYHREFRGIDGAYIHDALAVGLAIDEEIARFENLCLDVIVTGKEAGRLFVKQGSPNVRFCRKVDFKKFLNLFLDRLMTLSLRAPKGRSNL